MSGSLLATRRSLVDRLANWDDRKRWQEFFDTYWKLIYSAARKSGLTDAEAQEVVQETIITVAKKIDKLKYDPAIGSFKGWLLQITRWRIVDQFRKREPGAAKRPRSPDDRFTATIERVPDPHVVDLDALWETEWQENLFAAAIARGEKESRAETISDFRLLRAQRVARAKSRRPAAGEGRPGLSGASPRRRTVEKGNQSAGEDRPLRSTSSPAQLPRALRLCKIALIPEEVSAQTPIIPDHEVLRVIGRGAYGEIWLARTLTGGLRAVKVVYRTTFESERAFQREFQGMSAFEPISRAHGGFRRHPARRAHERVSLLHHGAGRRSHGRPQDRHRQLRTAHGESRSRAAQTFVRVRVDSAGSLADRSAWRRCMRTDSPIAISNLPTSSLSRVCRSWPISAWSPLPDNNRLSGPKVTCRRKDRAARKPTFSVSANCFTKSAPGKDRLDFPELDSQLSDRADKEQLLQLNDVLVKACANDPRKRYASAAEMHGDLAALERGQRPPKKEIADDAGDCHHVDLARDNGRFFLVSRASIAVIERRSSFAGECALRSTERARAVGRSREANSGDVRGVGAAQIPIANHGSGI